MVLNPNGAVQANDFGNPIVITCKAREVISGGQFVTGSTAVNVVNSGLASVAGSDIQVYLNGSGQAVTGIALATVASGAYVPVALRGVFLLTCRTDVSGGEPVSAAGDDSLGWGTVAGQAIGRAIVNGTSGGYTLAALQFF